MNVKETLEKLQEALSKDLESIETIEALQDLKAKYLGKKAELSLMMRHMKDLPNEEKPVFGQTINQAKQRFGKLIEKKRTQLAEAILNKKLEKETIDVTMTSPDFRLGTTHLLNQIIDDIEDLFIGMGYLIKEGPEIESDERNFEMLNLPKNHPARDMQDSFYVTEEALLRTHTSPVQVRTMLEYGGKKPVKIICPGKVYRRDDDDATHSHQFMQIEGLVVDDKTSMSDLKGTLLAIARSMFGEDRQIRLRPSYFPFTEPSVEVDVTCSKCDGKGCAMCKHTGYIEILGAGMVHDNVLRMSGYDPEIYQGFAFGVGVERLAMLKYGIDDIRHFYTNDLRFNRQFK